MNDASTNIFFCFVVRVMSSACSFFAALVVIGFVVSLIRSFVSSIVPLPPPPVLSSFVMLNFCVL